MPSVRLCSIVLLTTGPKFVGFSLSHSPCIDFSRAGAAAYLDTCARKRWRPRELPPGKPQSAAMRRALPLRKHLRTALKPSRPPGRACVLWVGGGEGWGEERAEAQPSWLLREDRAWLLRYASCILHVTSPQARRDRMARRGSRSGSGAALAGLGVCRGPEENDMEPVLRDIRRVMGLAQHR